MGDHDIMSRAMFAFLLLAVSSVFAATSSCKTDADCKWLSGSYCQRGSCHGAMPTKYIGKDVHGRAVRMPMMGLGTWQYNDTVAGQAVAAALKMGYEHIDTANIYANQVGIGKALKASSRKRASYFITTKIGGGLNQSTAELQFKQNLLQVHYPCTMDAKAAGGKAGRQSLWKVMESFYHSGRARSIGVSHYCKRHLEDVFEIATVRPMINQVQYHVGMASPTTSFPNATDDKEFDETHGVVYQSFSPLCGPCGTTELIDGPLVTKIAAKYKSGLDGSPISGAQVSLRWQVQQGIPVIPKTHKNDYLKQDKDLFSWKLSAQDMAALSAATSPAVAGGDAGPPATSGDCSIA